MEELIDHLPLWAKVVIPFVLSNTGWFIRQYLWERRVRKKHKEITDGIRALHEQIGHLAIGLLHTVKLSEADERRLREVFDQSVG